MKSRICPYCFERIAHGQTVFRCINRACAPEIDKELAAFIGTKPELQSRTFAVPVAMFRSVPRQAPCVKCGYLTPVHVCPHCHNMLPSQFEELDNIMIGLLGAKESGKTNYIGVLIDRLRNEVGRNFQAPLNALDTHTSETYAKTYRKPLFEESTVIPITQVAQARKDLRYPLNYSLNLTNGGLLHRGRAMSLSLFDTAGEDLEKHDDVVVATHLRYISNAKGLLLLLDPLQLPGVRAQLPAHAKTGEHHDPEGIVDLLIRTLRRSHGVKAPKQLSVPIAVVFSKIDLVRPLMNRDAPLFHEPAHHGVYDEADGRAVHESIRAHLVQWGAQKFDTDLLGNFSRCRFFGVSSFGYQPIGNRLDRGVIPYRVEDPFLWLLAELGLIDRAKPGVAR